jgi:hypothetical protein
MEILIGFIVGVLSNLLTSVIWEVFLRDPFLKLIGRPSTPPVKQGLEGWLEVIGWSILPIIFPLSAMMLVQYRWPLSLPGKIELLAGSFLIAAVVVIGMRFASLRRPTRQIGVALIAVGLGVAMIAFYLLEQLLPNFVALDCPNKVETMTTLQGRIIDPQWRVYVLVLPRRGGGSWVNRASAPGEDGTWYATCSFGGGDGEIFEVYALALPPDVSRSIKIDSPLPQAEWLEYNARYKTSICVVTKQ